MVLWKGDVWTTGTVCLCVWGGVAQALCTPQNAWFLDLQAGHLDEGGVTSSLGMVPIDGGDLRDGVRGEDKMEDSYELASEEAYKGADSRGNCQMG